MFLLLLISECVSSRKRRRWSRLPRGLWPGPLPPRSHALGYHTYSIGGPTEIQVNSMNQNQLVQWGRNTGHLKSGYFILNPLILNVAMILDLSGASKTSKLVWYLNTKTRFLIPDWNDVQNMVQFSNNDLITKHLTSS